MLLRLILSVQMEDFGTEVLVFKRPKGFVQADMITMSESVLRVSLQLAHSDIHLLEAHVWPDPAYLARMEEFGMVRIVSSLLKEVVPRTITLTEHNALKLLPPLVLTGSLSEVGTV